MGNWMTVGLSGSVSPEELPALRDWVNIGDDWGRFHPLANVGPSLCGLGDWTGREMNTSGNLSERDYTVGDVAEALRGAVQAAPSLYLKVHCGGDHESSECVATITVHKGEVTVGRPEVAEVKGRSVEDIRASLYSLLR